VHVLLCKFALNAAGDGHLKAPLSPFAAFLLEDYFGATTPAMSTPSRFATLCGQAPTRFWAHHRF
jgi:hypothetical protein